MIKINVTRKEIKKAFSKPEYYVALKEKIINEAIKKSKERGKK